MNGRACSNQLSNAGNVVKPTKSLLMLTSNCSWNIEQDLLLIVPWQYPIHQMISSIETWSWQSWIIFKQLTVFFFHNKNKGFNSTRHIICSSDTSSPAKWYSLCVVRAPTTQNTYFYVRRYYEEEADRRVKENANNKKRRLRLFAKWTINGTNRISQ